MINARKTVKLTLYLLLSGILILFSIYGYIGLNSNVKIHSEVEDLPNYRIALVLGTSVKLADGGENLYFSKRMEAAHSLYKTGKVSKILVSGDNGHISYNEPIYMKNALLELGVPDKDIILDYAGFRTFDSMVRAKEVFGLDSIIVVSQRFHLQRAIFIAESKGLNVVGYVAEDPPQTIRTKLREIPARVSAFLDCFILNTQPRFLGEPEIIEE